MTGVKIKACKKPVIEAYIGTLIERAFCNNADIRFCHRLDRFCCEPAYPLVQCMMYMYLNFAQFQADY